MVKKITILLNSNKEGAGLNRIKLCAQGFEEQGIEVQWIYLLNKNLKYKAFQLGNVFIQCIRLLFLKNSKIWVYGHKPNIILSLIKNNELIFERTEYPKQLITSNTKQIENLNGYKYATKFITCSDALIDYYSAFTKETCTYIKIPAVVNYSNFSSTDTISPFAEKQYIAYCGDMNNNKDGVYDLLKAFAIVSSKKPDFYLCLIGTASITELEKIKSAITDFNIQNRVILTGRIPHHLMPGYLINAKLVALARPNNKQAEGGFPSKLAEYLCTGTPTLVTSVGEIPLYIKHKENGFLSEPNNPEQFANEMIKVLEDYENSKLIAANGQRFAKKEFSYKENSKRIADFIFDY